MVKAGDTAPGFSLLDAEGKTVKLSDFRGQKVVLYFYPHADTPGCTTETCAFRDALPQFDTTGAVILGVSPDTPGDQLKFARKFAVPFRLLCDTDHAVAEAYGVWVEKTNYGKTYMGIQRSTFIIDADGNLAKVFPRVKVEGHAEEVLKSLTV